MPDQGVKFREFWHLQLILENLLHRAYPEKIILGALLGKALEYTLSA